MLLMGTVGEGGSGGVRAWLKGVLILGVGVAVGGVRKSGLGFVMLFGGGGWRV